MPPKRIPLLKRHNAMLYFIPQTELEKLVAAIPEEDRITRAPESPSELSPKKRGISQVIYVSPIREFSPKKVLTPHEWMPEFPEEKTIQIPPEAPEKKRKLEPMTCPELIDEFWTGWVKAWPYLKPDKIKGMSEEQKESCQKQIDMIGDELQKLQSSLRKFTSEREE